jgi:hypothetical protein
LSVFQHQSCTILFSSCSVRSQEFPQKEKLR